MNVLILGSGAREHAIGWTLRKQNECGTIFIHPGNPGTLDLGFKNFSEVQELSELITSASQNKVNLVVIGPEALLAKGYADAFRKAGFLVVGPNQSAAQLESSKVFAKEFMNEAGIPTSSSRIFTSREELENSSQNQWPWVLKLDGLAAGKGVVIAHSRKDVSRFCDWVWKDQVFGSGPHKILTETFIIGQEMSYIGFCDGKDFIPLESATDYKRLYDQDRGPNTGGMGALSPSPFLNPALEARIHQEVIRPLLSEMSRRQLEFRGVLFIGLMIDATGAPWVLEFNTRMGDPETQCILPRLKSSLLSLLMATAEAKLQDQTKPNWDERASVFVVATSPGYPESPELGSAIQGLEKMNQDIQVFFAGVTKKGTQYFTHGGRVLGLGCLAKSVQSARHKVYDQMSHLFWPGIHYRKDIGLNLNLEDHKISVD